MTSAAPTSQVEHDLEFEAAFWMHMPWLHRRISLMIGDSDEASDITQETFARAAVKWPIGSRDEVARWLATVGTRLAIDELRRRRRWGFLRIRDTSASWAMETDPDLWKAIFELDPPTRAALLLTILDGYTQEEVAGILGMPRGTIASRLSRARARLRTVIGDADDGR